MCINHPKIFSSQTLSSPLGLFSLNSFQGFDFLGGRIEPILCLVFYFVMKMWESFYKKKNISNMANSSKNIQKMSKCSNGNKQKWTNIVS